MKYWTKHGKMGMVNKHARIEEDFIYKNSKNIVSYNPHKTFDLKTSYAYIPEDDFKSIPKKNIKSKYHLTQTLSKLDERFFRLYGKEFREIRETRNKFNKLVAIKNDAPIEEVLSLIALWDEQRGQKYGWQRHSGIDRNFFNKFYKQEEDNLQSLFFYIDDKLVGYSIISLEPQGDEYTYIIRKNDTSYRNLTLYIDYKSFEYLYNSINKDFLINWGASSGSLLKYKEKFPVYKQEKLYFYRLKE